MNVVKCKNGHFYDGELYQMCPHCGAAPSDAPSGAETKNKPVKEKRLWGRKKAKQKDVQAEIGVFHIPDEYTASRSYSQQKLQQEEEDRKNRESTGAERKNKGNGTYSLWDPIQEQQDRQMEEEQADKDLRSEQDIQRRQWQQTPSADVLPERDRQLQDAIRQASASSEGKTMSYFDSMTQPASDSRGDQAERIEPVVGWLVCVEGPYVGTSYSLHAGKNTIGRGSENDIVLSCDSRISRSKHATIIYEPKKREFYLQPGEGSGLTYYNSDYIPEVKKMESHATVELGETCFLFVPLCGSEFTWEDKLKKE